MEIETVIQKEIRKGTLMVILMAMQTVYESAGEKRWVLRLHQKVSTSPSMVPWKVIVRANVKEQIKQTVTVYESAGEKRWVLRLHQKVSTSPSMVPWKVIVREQIIQTATLC